MIELVRGYRESRGLHPPFPACPADLQSCIVIAALQGDFPERKTDGILWSQGNTLEGRMTKYEILFTETADKNLQTIKRGYNEYVQKIIDKIKFCLGEHLFTSIKQCNKKRLKGKENTHRLHIQRKFTVFYKVVETEGETFVRVYRVMGYEAAHKRYPYIDL